MSDRAPRLARITHDHAAVATATTRSDVVARADEAGFVSAVTFTPVADITGVNTNTRRLRLINKGADGNGTAVVASLQFDSGVNASDFDDKALTVDDANDAVAAGDILALESAAIGTGLADPGGMLTVELSRSDS